MPRRLRVMPAVAVSLYPKRGGVPIDLLVYGISQRDAMMIPTGGQIVRRAARVAGLNPDDWNASLFGVRRL